MHLLHVVGARPNFVKLAAVSRALDRLPNFQQTILHTGQHPDFQMSEVFFRELEIPSPELKIRIPFGASVAEIAHAIRNTCDFDKLPDLLIVYGDVNSTAAGAIAARQLGIPVAHVEAGLRSFDPDMCEEKNRILADHNSHLLFTPSADADDNLLKENIGPAKIHQVGNVMIDSLVRLLPRARFTMFPLPPRYLLVTLHRPQNVDHPEGLMRILETLKTISDTCPIFFPAHPRTQNKIRELGVTSTYRFRFLSPLPYLEFLALQRDAAVVITDSGGVQEETTYLNVPCLTLRNNTERPITIAEGTNRVVGSNPEVLPGAVAHTLSQGRQPRLLPPLWDGHAAERVARCIADFLVP